VPDRLPDHPMTAHDDAEILRISSDELPERQRR
jgi:hypothetical protein